MKNNHKGDIVEKQKKLKIQQYRPIFIIKIKFDEVA